MVEATVAVTGANGFIASWVVKLLLERGYNVRGTVRDPDDTAKVGHLLELPGAKERLVLYKASLLDEGVFDDIFYGTDGVFHTASPCTIKAVLDPERDVVIPAVEGTLNVLTAAAKAKNVKRIVLTSSECASTYSEAAYHHHADPNVLVDESWWSDQEWCKNNKMWYPLSKTKAELAAWEFAKEKDLDLVVLNPSLVLGPILQSSINSSTERVIQFLDGSMKEYPNRVYGVVHVKDVAEAHILAFENPSAQGRYLLIEKSLLGEEMADLLRGLCPGCPVPNRCQDNGQPVGATFGGDKIRNLGLVYTPAEEAIKECVDDLKAKKWLKCPS